MKDNGLTTNVLFQAEDFYEAFKRCLKEIPYESSSGKGTIVSIPAIVNGAFSLELYFNLLSKRYYPTHHLSKLFSHIDNKTRKTIIDSTLPKLNRIYQYKDSSFEDILNDIDNLFVEWRYIFNKNKQAGFFGNRINRYIPALTLLLDEISVISRKCYKDLKNIKQ